MPHSRTIAAITLLAGLLATTLACGETSPAPANSAATLTAGHRAWQANALAKLGASKHADALVTAAALASLDAGNAAQALSLVDRALLDQPKAADIGLFAISLCARTPRCDLLRREAELRAIDPGNGAGWMAALQHASNSKDSAGVEQALTQIAQASQFDLDFVPLERRFISGLAEVPAPFAVDADSNTPEAQRRVWAISVTSALATPGFQSLLQACKQDSAGDKPALRQRCRLIATRLVGGDRVISNMVGLRLQEWAANNDQDRQSALTEQRRMNWRLWQLGDIATKQQLSTGEQTAILIAHDNESDGIAAVLTAAHRPLDPPADWQPAVADHPHARSLAPP